MTLPVTLADGTVLDVAKWPLPAGVEDGVVNRAQLAKAFSVSENTVTKWISQGMPVLTEGQNGVSYELMLSHCWAWRQWRDDRARAAKDLGDRIAAQAALAFLNLGDDASEDERPMTAAETRAWAEAEFHRNRVAEQRGDLMRAARVRQTMEDIMVGFGTALDTLPDWAELEFGLTPDQVQKLQDRADAIRLEARREIDRLLGDSAVVSPSFGQPQADMGF